MYINITFLVNTGTRYVSLFINAATFHFKFWDLKELKLGIFCPWAIVYCYLEFKLRYLKNLKLFSTRVKELFEPIVLQR